MKKKFDWNQAITWKGYLKLCAISFIAELCVYFGYIIKLNHDFKKSEIHDEETVE